MKIGNDNLKDKDNAKMICLEHERDWFREEAERLDNICKDQIEKINEMKFKQKLLIDDKNYFEGFVVKIKKKNKQLRQDLITLSEKGEINSLRLPSRQ